MILFVDSSEYLAIGLLNEKLEWLDFEQISNRKNSELFHTHLYEMLKRNKAKIVDIQTVFQCAGPGSYTGMRLSDGLCQVLEWQSTQLYSFYHFEVPSLLEIKNGVWISEAFKGEFFCYQWDGEKTKTELIPKDGRDSQDWIEQFYGEYDHVYTHFPVDGFECEYTIDLIRKNSKTLFAAIKDKQLKRVPYYYRPLEKEFKQTQRS